MARVTIHVPAFDYVVDMYAVDEDEVWDNLDTYSLGAEALDRAEIKEAEYDEPEPEDE
jgi:hypothetical protein